MNEAKTIDVPADVAPENSQPQQQALTVRDAVTALDRPMEQTKPAVTAAQSKIDAIANLTAAAYAKASELRLTTDESAALCAEFGDEEFRTGAAGKEELIYIQHSALRNRLNKVLGLGQWAIVPRSRWAEDYEYYDKTNRCTAKASRVYVEAMLLIRGCFVSESIGDMTYYPKNQQTNYGDAVEGAQSEALRRCCKNFGIGLQAWDKTWCEGWWQRKNEKAAAARNAARQQQARPQAEPAKAQSAPAAAPTAAARPAQPGTEESFPIVNVLTVKEVHSKPDAPKKWTAYFIRFTDGIGEFEAATFDKKIAELANDLANTNECGVLTTKPGRKEGSKEIVRLERADQPPPTAEDNEPDNNPDPSDDVIP